MVLAHVADSWTRDADRDRTAFYWAIFVGGLASPAFLFLAGLGTALSGAAKRRVGQGRLEATLALGWGAPIDFLKVDILNVMGLALVVAAALWGLGGSPRGQVIVAGTVTVALAMAAPLVRTAAWIDRLPAPLQWYWRPTPGHTNFTLVPWAAFVFAGVAAGAALSGVREEAAQRRLQAAFAGLAAIVGLTAYWASFQPSLYPPGMSTYWGASPAFFFLRLAIVIALLPLAWSVRRLLPGPLAAALATIGAASLFAYWVHVELVYGGISIPIKRRVPFELTLLATFAIAYGLARLVPRARQWVAERDRPPVRVRRLVARLL